MMVKRFIMNWVKGEMTMGRYIVYLVIVLGMLIGAVLLAGCEKEGAEKVLGEPVDVVFTVNYGGYEEADVLSRGGKIMGAARKVVPLGDGLFLEATLRAGGKQGSTVVNDELRTGGKQGSTGGDGELRAPTAGPLSEGQLVTLAAFTSPAGVAAGSANYKVVSGVLTPTGATALRVPTGETYHFVAYSYNSTANYPGTTNIDPGNDLMWGRTVNPVSVTAKDLPVTINMRHLFAQVTMEANVSRVSDAVIKTMVAAVAGGWTVDLTLADGTVEADEGAVQTLTWATTLPAAAAASVPRTVIPADVGDPENVVVSISNMVVTVDGDDYAASNQSIEFDGALEAGKSYTLVLNVNRTRWAGSNVYWSEINEHPVFDYTARTAKPEGTNRYQGIFFKWGSLVGIAPYPKSNPTIYIPNSSGSKYTANYNMNSNHTLWTSPGTYAGIPSLHDSGLTFSSTGTGANSLYDHGLGTYTGDICNKIDAGWRMPNADELGVETDYNYDDFTNGSDPGDSEGMGIMTAGIEYNSAFGQVFFPASGWLEGSSSGQTEFVGNAGGCWAGSWNASGRPYRMNFYHETGYSWLMGTSSSPDAYTVRCIKKLPSE